MEHLQYHALKSKAKDSVHTISVLTYITGIIIMPSVQVYIVAGVQWLTDIGLAQTCSQLQCVDKYALRTYTQLKVLELN